MQSEAGNTTRNNIDATTFEADVRRVVEPSRGVQKIVRNLTVQMISNHSFDIESVRKIANAVLRGARESAEKASREPVAQFEITRTRLEQVVTGLVTGGALLAKESKQELKEAAGQAQAFSRENLVRVRTDLEGLETMFLDTLQSSASDAKDTAGQIFTDRVEHSCIHASVVGLQLQNTLGGLTHQIGTAGRTQLETALHLAQSSTARLWQIAAGARPGGDSRHTLSRCASASAT